MVALAALVILPAKRSDHLILGLNVNQREIHLDHLLANLDAIMGRAEDDCDAGDHALNCLCSRALGATKILEFA